MQFQIQVFVMLHLDFEGICYKYFKAEAQVQYVVYKVDQVIYIASLVALV